MEISEKLNPFIFNEHILITPVSKCINKVMEYAKTGYKLKDIVIFKIDFYILTNWLLLQKLLLFYLHIYWSAST